MKISQIRNPRKLPWLFVTSALLLILLFGSVLRDSVGLAYDNAAYNSTALADGALVFVSSTSIGKVDGFSIDNEDILAYNTVTDTWAMHFDGSDVGLGESDTTALHILDDDDDNTLDPILMSFDKAMPIAGAADDSDIVRFTPTSLSVYTAGSFSLELDWSSAGLTWNSEGVDGVTTAPDGRLVISTNGFHRVPKTSGGNLTGKGEDLIVLT